MTMSNPRRPGALWRIAAALCTAAACAVMIGATAACGGSDDDGAADATPAASATARAASPTTAATAPTAAATAPAAGETAAPATTTAPQPTQAPSQPTATPAVAPTQAPPPPPPPPPPGESRITVTAVNVKFAPASLIAPLGSTVIVTLDNQDTGVQHDIVFFAPGSDTAAGSDLVLGPGTATITFTPAVAGAYPFKCSVHPQQMRGVLNVQ